MAFKFEDNRMEVKAALSDAIEAFLNEAAGEMVSQFQRNSRVDTGQTKGSYNYKVSETGEGIEANMGSSYENAIWEEFGTGEFAIEGGGRKGGWFYKDAKGEGHFTRGKTANRPMHRAYTAMRGKIQSRAQSVIGARLK